MQMSLALEKGVSAAQKPLLCAHYCAIATNPPYTGSNGQLGFKKGVRQNPAGFSQRLHNQLSNSGFLKSPKSFAHNITKCYS